MRRNNVQIVGVAEGPDSSSTASVAKLLRDTLSLEKDILVDRSHRSLAPRKDGQPLVIIAKLHCDKHCAEMLRQAHQHGPFQYMGKQTAQRKFPRPMLHSIASGMFHEVARMSVMELYIMLTSVSRSTGVPRSSSAQRKRWPTLTTTS